MQIEVPQALLDVLGNSPVGLGIVIGAIAIARVIDRRAGEALDLIAELARARRKTVTKGQRAVDSSR